MTSLEDRERERLRATADSERQKELTRGRAWMTIGGIFLGLSELALRLRQVGVGVSVDLGNYALDFVASIEVRGTRVSARWTSVEPDTIAVSSTTFGGPSIQPFRLPEVTNMATESRKIVECIERQFDQAVK